MKFFPLAALAALVIGCDAQAKFAHGTAHTFWIVLAVVFGVLLVVEAALELLGR